MIFKYYYRLCILTLFIESALDSKWHFYLQPGLWTSSKCVEFPSQHNHCWGTNSAENGEWWIEIAVTQSSNWFYRGTTRSFRGPSSMQCVGLDERHYKCTSCLPPWLPPIQPGGVCGVSRCEFISPFFWCSFNLWTKLIWPLKWIVNSKNSLESLRDIFNKYK